MFYDKQSSNLLIIQMRQTLRYSIASKLLLLFLIANVSADERLKRQAGTTIRKWALNTVYYYFDPSLSE